jgi:hypothetical protein
VAYAAILSRTVYVLRVVHNGSDYIVPVDAITFHEFRERNQNPFEAKAEAMRL